MFLKSYTDHGVFFFVFFNVVCFYPRSKSMFFLVLFMLHLLLPTPACGRSRAHRPGGRAPCSSARSWKHSSAPSATGGRGAGLAAAVSQGPLLLELKGVGRSGDRSEVCRSADSILPDGGISFWGGTSCVLFFHRLPFKQIQGLLDLNFVGISAESQVGLRRDMKGPYSNKFPSIQKKW